MQATLLDDFIVSPIRTLDPTQDKVQTGILSPLSICRANLRNVITLTFALIRGLYCRVTNSEIGEGEFAQKIRVACLILLLRFRIEKFFHLGQTRF